MDEDRYYNLGSHDKLFNQIDELTDELASRDAIIAGLRKRLDILTESGFTVAKSNKQLIEQVKMLREFVKLLRDYIPASAVGNMTVQEALAATKHHDRS